MNQIKYLIKSYREFFREGIRRHIYMRKLRFAVNTADDLHRITKRKYYVVHDISGDPTIVTAQQVKELQAKGRLPKEWSHIDLEHNAIYIPFKLKDEDKKLLNLK